MSDTSFCTELDGLLRKFDRKLFVVVDDGEWGRSVSLYGVKKDGNKDEIPCEEVSEEKLSAMAKRSWYD